MIGKITTKEFKKRLGYLLLGVFAFYIVDPLRDFIGGISQVHPIIIGVGGFMLTLYFFDF